MSRASALLIGATALSAATLAFGQTFMVNTPSSLITCQPYNIQWTGGVAPYFPIITQAGQVSQIIEQFPQTNQNNYLWTVNQPAGQTVTIVVGDSQGMQALSGISPAIVAGADTSCVGKRASASSGATSTGAAASATSAASSASSAATSAASSVSSAASSVASSVSRSVSSVASSVQSSASAAATSVRPNSAAKTSDYSAMVAGVVGVVAAALI